MLRIFFKLTITLVVFIATIILGALLFILVAQYHENTGEWNIFFSEVTTTETEISLYPKDSDAVLLANIMGAGSIKLGLLRRVWLLSLLSMVLLMKLGIEMVNWCSSAPVHKTAKKTATIKSCDPHDENEKKQALIKYFNLHLSMVEGLVESNMAELFMDYDDLRKGKNQALLANIKSVISSKTTQEVFNVEISLYPKEFYIRYEAAGNISATIGILGTAMHDLSLEYIEGYSAMAKSLLKDVVFSDYDEDEVEDEDESEGDKTRALHTLDQFTPDGAKIKTLKLEYEYPTND